MRRGQDDVSSQVNALKQYMKPLRKLSFFETPDDGGVAITFGDELERKVEGRMAKRAEQQLILPHKLSLGSAS